MVLPQLGWMALGGVAKDAADEILEPSVEDVILELRRREAQGEKFSPKDLLVYKALLEGKGD